MPLTPGASFGAYRVIEPLGRGGMAAVHKAYEPALDRYVALKILPVEFMHESGFEERFEREARLVAKLEHRHIVPIYNFGIEEGTPWMTMRLVPGGTLAGLLRRGRLDRTRALVVLRESAEALDYAHSLGVLHRDVKPQNILLDQQGHVYLADFGIAKMVEGTTVVTSSGVITGTPQYMSPEQWQATGVDHRTDIYALGVVAYEMLAGRVPFSADTPAAMMTKHLLDPIPIPAPSEVPEPLLRPLLKCLDKIPAARWPSASSFVGALEGSAGAPEPVERTMTVFGSTAAAQEIAAAANIKQRKAIARSPAYWLGILALSILGWYAGSAVTAHLKRQTALTELTLVGVWHGTYSSSELGYGRAILTLTQSGTSIEGTWSATPDEKLEAEGTFARKPDGTLEKVAAWSGAGTVSGTSGTINATGTSVTFPLTLSPSDPKTCELRATMTTTIFSSPTDIFSSVTSEKREARHVTGEWVTFNCAVAAAGRFILAKVQ